MGNRQTPTVLIPRMEDQYLEELQAVVRSHIKEITDICKKSGVQTLIVVPNSRLQRDEQSRLFYIVFYDKRSPAVNQKVSDILEAHNYEAFFGSPKEAVNLSDLIDDLPMHEDDKASVTEKIASILNENGLSGPG